MADVNLDRRAPIYYKIVHGDTFAPPSVTFTINGTPEDFSNATLRMSIRKNGALIKEITDGDGITVLGNQITYFIEETDMETLFVATTYDYDVTKTDITSGDVVTIQGGTIQIRPTTVKPILT